jgi:hypothetical protein
MPELEYYVPSSRSSEDSTISPSNLAVDAVTRPNKHQTQENCRFGTASDPSSEYRLVYGECFVGN